jgi:tetratricopeptide (TPR) repeat protein
MRKLFIILIILLAGSACLPAQETTDPEKLFSEGVFFFLAEEYQEALYNFLQLQKQFPENANFNFKVGETYLQIPGQQPKAIPYLEKAVTRTTLKYKARSYSEDNAPHYAFFSLGNAYRINNEVEKALDTYQAFKESDDFEGNYNVGMVDDEIRKCQRAQIIKDAPLILRKTKLDVPVNTGSNDYNPILSGDGKTLVYVTALKFFDAIELSRNTDGTWSEPDVLNPQVGSDGNLYPVSLNYDGTELYLVDNDETNRDIYISRLDGKFWSKAEKLGPAINSKSHETHACVSSDGNTLYFTSDRKGGIGKLDIYLSEKTDAEEWGEPINLGDKINSEADEETPFITKDNNRLFFSSAGHFNMGGFDIFYSDLINEKWTDPINAGFPINTTGDDLFYFPVDDEKFAYMSLIDINGSGFSDIYLIEILGKPVSDQKTGEVIIGDGFRMLLINQESSDTLIIRYDPDEKRFHLNQAGNKYKIIVNK